MYLFWQHMTCNKNRDLGQRILKDFRLNLKLNLSDFKLFAASSTRSRLCRQFPTSEIESWKIWNFFFSREIDPEIANIGRKECKVLVFHFCQERKRLNIRNFLSFVWNTVASKTFLAEQEIMLCSWRNTKITKVWGLLRGVSWAPVSDEKSLSQKDQFS